MNVLSIGGDARMTYCVKRLTLDKNFTACGAAEGCDVLLLPYTPVQAEYIKLPYGDDISAAKLIGLVRNGGYVFSGKLDDDIIKRNDSRIRFCNWFADEILTLENAKLTAEGASEILTRKLSNAVGGSNILITGWGRVAKACAELFGNMGAGVTVCARSEEALENAKSRGFRAAGFIDKAALSEADAVVNTVPARVFEVSELSAVKKDALYLELASKPYGTDFEAAERMGIRTLLASGIPGKYTPERAGYALALSVMRRIGEGGENGG